LPAQALTNVIETKDLCKQFRDLIAVDSISFTVRQGECFGLLGPNGAGKTSTIRMIYGFSPMTAGELRVFGLDIATQWRAIRSRLGVCQQENNLDPDLTVLKNLEVFASYFDMPASAARRRALELLRFISLEQRAHTRIPELSGGMMRRLILARALINDPELLILDEPTTGLDPQSRHQVWEKIEELRSRGISVLLTTHYMDEASRLCDRLVIMDQGKILVEGRPADLIERHVGRHVMEVHRPDTDLRRFIDEQNLAYDDLVHRIILYGSDTERLFDTLSSRYGPGSCTLRMATLEDVFLRLTGRELRD
jgi:lipooligosaccharide transport system ATP-binding protein